MTTTAHTADTGHAEPLLWPLLHVLARTRTAPGRLRRPGSADATSDRRPPRRFGDSYLWPDGTWTHSG